MTIIQDSYPHDSSVRPSPSLNAVLPSRANPLDSFERIAIAEHYDYERLDGTELNISLPGRCGSHDLSLRWNPALEQIQIFLVLESRSPAGRTDRICRLMSLLNERLTAGHFDYWERNASLVYRHNASLRGGAKLHIEQAMDIISTALDAAECGFPASQYVIWAGKTPEDALNQALSEAAMAVI
jgi:hypothetical protein